MTKPKIADTRCEILDLDKGTYYWCACGESKNQPMCDGSHKGTTFNPVEFQVLDSSRPVKLCLCKHTKKPPYCDGSHGSL